MNRGRAPVPPAVDVLGWAWVLSALVPAVVGRPDAVPLVAVVAVGLATAAHRWLALVRPASGALRGSVWTAGAAVALAALGSTRPVAEGIATLSLSAAAAAVAGLTLPAPAAAVTAVVLQAWLAAWVLGSGTDTTIPLTLVESVLVTATSCLTAVLVARAIRVGRQRTDGLVAGLLADRRTLRADEARDRARRAARADLHDTVLTTLSAVGAGWTRRADPDELRAEFERSAAALREPPPGPEAGMPLLEALRSTAAAPRFGGLRVDVSGDEVEVAGPVAAALRLATGEALTNVAKHAEVERARVRVRRHADQVEVTVIDEGAGVRSGPPVGLGLPDSVAGRMAAVGGQGLVRSETGRGTAVVLRSPLATPVSSVPLPTPWSDRGPLTAALWLTGGTLLTGAAGVLLVPGRTAPATAGWALGAVAAVVVLVLGWTHRFPAGLAALLAITGPVVVLLANLPAGGCTALAAPPTPAALGAGAAGLLLAVARPHRDAVLGLVATLSSYGLAASLATDAGPACTAAAGSTAAVHLGQVGAAIVVVSSLRRRADQARQALLLHQTHADRHQDADALAGERDRLLPVVRLAVADTLDGLARGDLDPQQDSVRARCRQDARLVRSLLTQGGDADLLLRRLVELAVDLRAQRVDLAVRGTLPIGSLSDRTAASAVDGCAGVLGRLSDAGWSGEAEVTVLTTGSDVALTLVAHDLGGRRPDGYPTWGTWDPPHVEIQDGSLWLSTRATLDREEPQ
ncbi:ATP-binding protein [Klenkia sp. LSe6-5]|uniref:histidine kinase n=1 Tax=Klenkia sesuvii TaxID=3103137 RepID=A0ABU8DWF6_9ACTN